MIQHDHQHDQHHDRHVASTGKLEHDAPLAFEAPGPGYWELETTHHGVRPLSRLIREAYERGGTSGFGVLVEKYGLPLAEIQAAFVEGCIYMRPKAVGEGKRPSAPPPRPIMWLAARLHPELRRRNRTAATAWSERLWRTEVDQWFEHDRQEMYDRNLALQSVDLMSLGDAALASHLTDCLTLFEHGAHRNLATHGGDIMPTGDLLAHGERWGLDAATMSSLLAGCSPATVETAVMLRPVAAALAAAPEPPDSIDGVRALGDEVSAAVDAWIETHAWRLVTSDDIDHPTLAELPALQLRALLAATTAEFEPADPAPIRDRVPESDRPLFDELLAEARYGHRQRDDIRGLCWNWPGGLVRRAMLEAGRRLTVSSRLERPEHAAELSPAELDTALRGGVGPSADVAAARATRRDRVEAAPPPRSFGEPEAAPPLDAFPRPIARATAAMLAMMMAEATPHQEPLHGLGIGDEVYRGRACVVRDVADAMEHLESGDVLIAPFTGPAFNSLLPLVGALVVEEGGTLSHAAIVAREFGIPALVGTAGATGITTGTIVEVDPMAGILRT
jgi:phosphohistidine swiveling domain-containing protein